MHLKRGKGAPHPSQHFLQRPQTPTRKNALIKGSNLLAKRFEADYVLHSGGE